MTEARRMRPLPYYRAVGVAASLQESAATAHAVAAQCMKRAEELDAAGTAFGWAAMIHRARTQQHACANYAEQARAYLFTLIGRRG